MKQLYPTTVYENVPERQLARILSLLIGASWGAYLFVILTGLYYKDWEVIAVTLAGGALLIGPWILLRRRHLRASSLFFVLSALVTVTIIATVGQGIRDLAIMTFPVIYIFAGLTLNRALFRLCVGLTLAAVGWLVFGEIYGWFAPKPFGGEIADWFYLIGTTIILLIAALAVELLATNMQNSLAQAQQEIAQRKQTEEEVKNSERRLHALIEHGQDNISLLAADGTLLWENPSPNHILGYAPDQFRGRNIFELMHPEDHAWTSNMYAQVVQSPGSIQEGTFRLLHADGTWRWIEGSATNLLDEPSVQAIVLNYRDITERKQTEDELRESHRELALLNHASQTLSSTLDLNQVFVHLLSEIQNLLQAIGSFWLIDPATSELVCHQASGPFAQFVLGSRLQSGEGIAGWVAQHGTSLIVPDALADPRHSKRVAQKTGLVARSILCVPLKSKQGVIGVLQVMDTEANRFTARNQVLLESLAVTADSAIENARLYDVVQHDIAERKRAEDALRESQELLSLFMRYSPFYTYIKEATPVASRLLQASDNLQELTGIPTDAMIGKTADELFPAEFAAKITTDDWAVVSSGVMLKLDEDFNGRHYTTVKFPIVLGDRTLLAGYTIDITERKRAEEQLSYQSTHDALTDIYNRTFFETERARLEHSREFPVSVVVADVDRLKVVNDTQGHAIGDELLRHAAQVLGAVFRAGDVLARIGGDEFAVLLPATDAATADQMLARVKEQLAKHNTQYPDLPLRLSLGAATAEKNNLTAAFTLADQRMYADKATHTSRENDAPAI